MAVYYWVGGDGVWDASSTTNWSASSGGAGGAGAPNNTDSVIFDANSGTGTCTTASGSASALTTLNTSTLGLTLGANHTMTSTFTLTLGTLTLNSFTLSCAAFSSNNANTRSIAFGTGNITLTGNGVFVLSMANATNFTYTGAPTINATYAGAVGTRSFRFGATNGIEANVVDINISDGTDTISLSTVRAKSLNFTGFSGTLLNQSPTLFGGLTLSSGMTLVAGASPFNFAATSGTQQITTANNTVDLPLNFIGIGGTWAFQDALTQGSTRAFTITNGTVQIKDGVTSTVGSFVANNANLKFLQSTTPGAQATLSQASNTINAANLTIKDINATGGATWNALLTSNNVDAGNNSGWFFGDPPITLATEYTYSIRSFTQPRRF